jgi:hypothetical protein
MTLWAPAASASLPVYSGVGFPTIYGPADAEEFSWEVPLGERQELRQVDDQEIAVYYSNGTASWVIIAAPASDAHGVTVPTTIQVTGENVFTLTVHHREGNPAAGGAPFDYPIFDQPGWIAGPSHVEVVFLESADELERRERLAKEALEAAKRAARAARCHVPALHGATLATARVRLRRANCRLGAIAKSTGVHVKVAKVVGQSAAAGSSLPPDAKVGVRLGPGG